MKISALRRFSSTLPTGRGVVIGPTHPAYRFGRSIFSSRVFDAQEVQRVLKTGHQSRKIGKRVMKGFAKGWPVFTLTLEERQTCPRDCAIWGACYGNNMQAAERIVAGPALEQALWRELTVLQAAHGTGFLVRLHVLGDFYSSDYVALWDRALLSFPALHVFGFTARLPGTVIGSQLWHLADRDWRRFAIRFSGLSGPFRAARVMTGDMGDGQDAIACPAQTGAAECCATCALCWQSSRSIAFARH